MTRDEILEPLGHPCPQCGAKVRYPCHSRRGRPLDGGRVHPGRLRFLGMTDPEIDADPRRVR